MKTLWIKVLLVVLALATVLSFTACNTDTPGDNGDNGDNGQGTTPPDENGDTPGDGTGDGGEEDDGTGIDWNNTGLDGLALIYNNKARFQVVYTGEAGSSGIRKANDFVKKLRALNIEVADAVSDADASAVKSCEIIFGSGAKNRGEDVAISDKYLGKDGRTIKVVGTRVVVAGGNATQLDKAVTRFIGTIMGIKSSTKSLEQFAIASDFFEEALTSYEITSVKLAGIDLREFVIVEDFDSYTGGGNYFGDIKDFRDELYGDTGIWLEYVNGNYDAYEHKIIFRYNTDMDERGFAAYVSGGDFIVECSYANAFDKAYREVMNKYLFDLVGDVKIPATLNYVKDVSVACYDDFGADGTGKTDTFQAIYDTHVYANEGGQKVIGVEGAIYKIDDIPTPIPVKTDVDFKGATFRINDVGDTAHKNRSNPLFKLERDNAGATYSGSRLNEISMERTLYFGATSIPWLASAIHEKSYVILWNSAHRDFIRHGANQNSGSQRHDSFIVYPDGTIDPETEVCFEFENVTQVEIYSAMDTPVTIENGYFVNTCCQIVAASDFKNDYLSYKRGFVLTRPNVTLKEIHHTIEDEPELDLNYDSKYGKRNESYPYYGFLCIEKCYNLTVRDTTLVGHTVYYEDKPATTSTGGKIPDPVPMGSYDLTFQISANTYFYNVKQDVPSTGIGDSRYWGIMASNWSKNLVFDDCRLNRIDAHCGFWDCDIINTELGHSLNIIGGGRLYLKNVTKVVSSTFISIRGDYGGTFRGDIIIEDCTFMAANSYNSWRTQYSSTPVSTAYLINSGYSKDGANGYWEWDFGYDCYLGVNIVVDNLTALAKNTYLFPTFSDEVFKNATNLRITESITYRNMKPLEVCPDPNATILHSIPTYVEEDED